MRCWVSCPIAAVIVALGGCVEAEPAISQACEDSAISWQTFADGYVRNWCRGCHSAELAGDGRHGAPVGVNFNERGDMTKHYEHIKARATGDAPTMPPAGGPSEEERALFAAWLECGTP